MPHRALLVLIGAVLFPMVVLAQEPALRGLDPVALCKGKELAGLPEFKAQSGAYHYQFASEENRAAFQGDTARYEIQLGGACARMGPLSGTGDAQRWHVHKERIYIFASDQCREGFKKRHDEYLAIDEPEPKAEPGAAAASQALLARAVAAHGGEARLRAWRSYRHERTETKGDITEVHRLQLALPDRARVDADYMQGAKVWRYGRAMTPTANFFVDNGPAREMSRAAQQEMARDLQHEPLLALRLLLEGKGSAVVGEQRLVHGVTVQELAFWHQGHTVHFGVDADGRVRTARCRGRGPGLHFGAVELLFDDYQTVGGLVVPGSVRGTFDGKDAPALRERREKVEVDSDLPATLFQAPK